MFGGTTSQPQVKIVLAGLQFLPDESKAGLVRVFQQSITGGLHAQVAERVGFGGS
jgi:hypothetical protein